MPSFRVSDESINTYNCRVLSAGGDASDFLNNPVMLYMHDMSAVVGRWENLRQEGRAWYADPVFDTEDGALGADVAGKVERGFLKAASLGIRFDFADVVYNDTLNCYDITKWKFQEISIVSVGANLNALQLYDMAGAPVTQLTLSAQLSALTIPTQTPKSTMELEEIALAMGLPTDATKEQVIQMAGYAQTNATELANLKAQLAQQKTDEANRLIDDAVSDKRIAATAKPAYLKLFAADHEAATLVLAGLPKPQNLVQLANTGAAQTAVATLATAEADAQQFDDLDRKGQLLKLKQTDPVTFTRLFTARYGVAPTHIL